MCGFAKIKKSDGGGGFFNFVWEIGGRAFAFKCNYRVKGLGWFPWGGTGGGRGASGGSSGRFWFGGGRFRTCSTKILSRGWRSRGGSTKRSRTRFFTLGCCWRRFFGTTRCQNTKGGARRYNTIWAFRFLCSGTYGFAFSGSASFGNSFCRKSRNGCWRSTFATCFGT